MWQALKTWFVGWLRGGPHFVVGPPGNPYLHRWYVLPRNPLLNVYLHRFLRDDDRALHDHPWWSLSLLLWGRVVEERFNGTRDPRTGARGTSRRRLRMGSLVVRAPRDAHRIELPRGEPAWTLFLTGPRLREWGFHCRGGWVPWHEFVDATDVGNVGRGCGELA